MHPPILSRSALSTAADGSLELAFTAGPGLYQFSVTGDARDFDWETMYVDLHQWGNHGERTGPWDFNPNQNNVPVVPSYWVELDGRRIGLWFFQRISAEDIAARRVRGNTVVHLPEHGRHVLRFTPYSVPMQAVRWEAPVIEPDPLDALPAPGFDLAGWPERSPFGRLAQTAWWDELRRRLDGDLAPYRPAVDRACEWIAARLSGAAVERLPGTPDDPTRFHADDILPLLFAYRLRGNAAARDGILRFTEQALALGHWGNQREDGYGCDGDIGASLTLRAMALVLHALRDELAPDLRQRMLARLELQGRRFFELSLLHRDYWGGSLIQDHGRLSLPSYAAGVLHLLGLVPEAERWAGYAIHRVQRALDAMPRDGVIPPSSYARLFLYLDPMIVYRDTLLALTGEDLVRQPPFAEIPGYLAAIARPAEHRMVVPLWGEMQLLGGSAGLNRIAAVNRDGLATALCLQTLACPAKGFYHEAERIAYIGSALIALLAPAPMPPPVGLPPPQPLRWWRDSGVAQYRDPEADVTLTLSCGPWCGFHAYRASACSCDRLDSLGGAGHFIINDGAANAVVSPDGAYSITSRLRNVLLIDGRGRHGDLDYPMSIPGFRHRGEQIEGAEWDAAQGAGLIRLDLGPAYPAEAGVIDYRRDFLVRRGGVITVRDRVVLDRPRDLAWLFHAAGAESITGLGGGRWRFGARLALSGALDGGQLASEVHDTPTVKGYSSPRIPYRHVRFAPGRPLAVAQAEFTFSPA